MIKCSIIGCCAFLVFSLQAQTRPNLYRAVDRQKMDRWVDSVFSRMSLDEKIGQLFMPTVAPDASAKNLAIRYIREMKIGGLLFSGGNLRNQCENLNYYQSASRIPLFVSCDGEWGLAMRLTNTPRFPKNMMLGAIEDNDLIFRYGQEMGRECREAGIHINFAPVLDINVNPANPVIGTRSFGEKRELVSEKAIAYAEGLESQNVIAVGKHFPGHGDTSDDSHKTLPQINYSKKRLEDVELYPFVHFINKGFAGIMTGHLSVPAFERTQGKPSSLSSTIVSDLLKKRLGFQGLAFTDALAMKGATSLKGSVCVRALLAGNDVLLNPNRPFEEFKLVKKAVSDGFIPLSLIEEKCIKLLQYKYIAGLNNYSPIKIEDLESRINTEYALNLTDELNREAVTVLKNRDNSLPIKDIDKKCIAVLSLGSDTIAEFQKRAAKYGNSDLFTIPLQYDEQTINYVSDRLRWYDEIICVFHTEKPLFIDYAALFGDKRLHLCFCTSPYIVSDYKNMINKALSVTLAYENTNGAQDAAAEIIMGGIPAKGKLPVSISNIFHFGDGISTKPIRLSFY
ncbi:MAG: glycoside hydrolase family 3 protein [Dysgonamonadaceae bacterium]|jgi:beta-glucosidase-like glycosyl hydrolase|nr:glycoside hydrolase family 3 protein [Dysgonamonadaceae bacterium]